MTQHTSNAFEPPAEDAADRPAPSARSSGRLWARTTVLAVLVAAAGFLAWRYGHWLTLENLARHEAALRQFQTDHPWLVIAVAFAIYVLVAGFSIPGATGLTLAYGWYFGWLQGTILVSFASTTGATVAFLLSRFFIGDWVQQRFGDRLRAVNERMEREGAWYLFTLRLIPLMPFFVLNLIMGLTRIRVRAYWIASQLGMLPATMVYVFAGSRVPRLQVLAKEGIAAIFTPSQLFQLTLAFAALGLFPLLARQVVRWLPGRRSASTTS